MTKIVLTIELEPGKSPQVTGPLYDKLLCYGLLELARDLIRDFKPSPIVPATQIPINGTQLGQPRP